MLTASPKSIAVLACLAAASAVTAQDPPTTPPNRTQQPTSSTTRNEADQVLASWVMLENNNEIALAQIAQTRAQNPEVKQFAEMMVKDHGEFGRKLQRFTSIAPEDAGPGHQTGKAGDTTRGTDTGRGTEVGRGTDTGTGRTGTDRGNPTGAAEASGQRGMAGGIDHVALLQELGRKHLETAKQELMQKQGADFDLCYMTMQIGAHAKVLDQLQVFPKYASPELRGVFETGQQTVRHHLEKAKTLAKQTLAAAKTDGTDGK